MPAFSTKYEENECGRKQSTSKDTEMKRKAKVKLGIVRRSILLGENLIKKGSSIWKDDL